MNNSQKIAETIEFLAKRNNITVSSVLHDLGMNKNALFTMKNSGYLPRLESLCKFADYFQCSLDYLLGRADEPTAKANNNIIATGNVITTGDISPVASGENSSSNGIVIDSTASAKDVAELVDLIQSLPLVKRAEAIVYMNNLKNGE